jgi:hypothetical protein
MNGDRREIRQIFATKFAAIKNELTPLVGARQSALLPYLHYLQTKSDVWE